MLQSEFEIWIIEINIKILNEVLNGKKTCQKQFLMLMLRVTELFYFVSLKFIKLFFVTTSRFTSGGHIFVAEVDTDYELHKTLEVGDIITAFGIYKDSTTSKFK